MMLMDLMLYFIINLVVVMRVIPLALNGHGFMAIRQTWRKAVIGLKTHGSTIKVIMEHTTRLMIMIYKAPTLSWKETLIMVPHSYKAMMKLQITSLTLHK